MAWLLEAVAIQGQMLTFVLPSILFAGYLN